VGEPSPVAAEGDQLLELYDRALPQVYGYLLSRCGGSVQLAEDLTSETFLAAAAAVHKSDDERPPVTVAWLVGIARHKLVDHWRRRARDERNLRAVADEDAARGGTVGDWDDIRLDALRAREALGRVAPHHRAALTLRYVDDLPVPDVAAHLGRTVHATEALLVRARTAFRRVYGEEAVNG
jgi:RNA polymerase sigma-70 factor (ECF subfamily)